VLSEERLQIEILWNEIEKTAFAIVVVEVVVDRLASEGAVPEQGDLVNGPEDGDLDWGSVDWASVGDDVRRLPQRIFTASRDG
jgi:hypothetical protein